MNGFDRAANGVVMLKMPSPAFRVVAALAKQESVSFVAQGEGAAGA